MDQRLTPNQPGMREQMLTAVKSAHVRNKLFWQWAHARVYCLLVGHEVQTTIIKGLGGRYLGTDCECPRCGKIFHKQRKEFR
jgi:hypothetical protein